MICSTIIPTIGRATLSRAVNSVLNQEFDRGEFEVIVVNDSGNPLAPEDWMRSPCVKMLNTKRRNRSVARNTGAAVAQGRYLHFLDDDDWMLPGAFKHLMEVAKTTQAAWVYGSFHLVDHTGKLLSEIAPTDADNCFIQMVASEWIPLQASWIESEGFFAAGGFASLYSLSGGYEDIDLSRKIARYHQFARCPEAVACIRYGDTGSTTDYNNLIVQNRQSRENCLEMPGAFGRMLTSAQASLNRTAYWHGKIVYYYLASIRWNLKQNRLTKASSRAVFCLLAFPASGRHLLSREFWRGIGRPHINLVRTTVGAAEVDLYRNTTWRS
ncbi:MAG TPA: glycosyltransferase family 2 protein [Anaerolineales bacterium]|nr:glycosyltransferase family 2 protein [Anaerolineales bacterium]